MFWGRRNARLGFVKVKSFSDATVPTAARSQPVR